MLRDPADLIAALEDTWSSTIEVCGQLTENDWARATGCPGWTVQDQLSHIVGLERVLCGDGDPDHVLTADPPHVTNDMQRYMELHVDVRRPVTAGQIVDELAATMKERLAQLNAMTDADFDAEMQGFMGMTLTLRRFLPIRVFDSYAHEQDIRRATGHAGHLAGLAAEHSRDTILAGWRRSAEEGAPAVRVVVTGPGGTTAVVPESDAPVATITIDSSNFIALGCGRADADRGEVLIEGDAAAANAVLDHASVTP